MFYHDHVPPEPPPPPPSRGTQGGVLGIQMHESVVCILTSTTSMMSTCLFRWFGHWDHEENEE